MRGGDPEVFSICQMSGSLADTSGPFFSYTEFTPVKSRKKRKNRTQRQEPVLTLIQGIRDDMAQSDWFSQSQSPSVVPFFAQFHPFLL